MGDNIIETLKELNVSSEDYVYLNYTDSAEVWHISDDYVSTALGETETAAMLAGAMATTGVTVLSRYDEDILGPCGTKECWMIMIGMVISRTI